MREFGQQKDGRWTVTLQGLRRVDQALKRVPWGVLLYEPVAPGRSMETTRLLV